MLLIVQAMELLLFMQLVLYDSGISPISDARNGNDFLSG